MCLTASRRIVVYFAIVCELLPSFCTKAKAKNCKTVPKSPSPLGSEPGRRGAAGSRCAFFHNECNNNAGTEFLLSAAA